jgi:hypothetical protein
MRRYLRFYLPILVGSLLAPLALGADKTPWYQVELIVFARPNAPATEVWPDQKPVVDGRDLVPWRGYAGADTVPFQRLPAASLKLGWEYTQLQKEMKPLLHIGWVQPGFTRTESVPVHIRSDENNSGILDGTVRLVRSRYLHLDTDLTFQRAGDANLFAITESRRIQSRQIHYLDNPMFGVITLITPYELPAGGPTPAR